MYETKIIEPMDIYNFDFSVIERNVSIVNNTKQRIVIKIERRNSKTFIKFEGALGKLKEG